MPDPNGNNLVETYGTSGNFTLDEWGEYYVAFEDTNYQITFSGMTAGLFLNGGNNDVTLDDGASVFHLNLDGNINLTTGSGNWGWTADFINLGGGVNALGLGSGSIGVIQGYQGSNEIYTGAGTIGLIALHESSNLIEIGSGGAGSIILGGSSDQLQSVRIGGWVKSLFCSSSSTAEIVVAQAGEVNYIATGNNADKVTVNAGWAENIKTKGGDDEVTLKSGVASFIRTGEGNDTVKVGTGSSEAIWLGEDNDTLTITGYDGTQTYMLFGGEGTDKLNFSKSATGVDASDDGLIIRGFETVILTNEADVVQLGSRDTKFNGNDGSDSLDGGGGNDTLNGGAGSDSLLGGGGSDLLNGGSGHDVITGGIGNDTMTGGAGLDDFIFSGNFGSDTITDFDSHNGEDIDLTAVTAITGFNDLLNNHLNISGGFAQIVVGGNSILLKDVAFDDVGWGESYSASDFIFA